MFRPVAVLAMLSLLLSSCAYSVLPEFPVYLEDRGASAGTVGIVIGAFFVASLAAQYPAGHAVDRFGPKAILILAAAVYAVGTSGYLVSTAPAACTLWRVLQGLSSATVLVTSLAFVARTLPPSMHGRGFTAILASVGAGLGVGPVLGGVFGVAHFHDLFALTTILAALTIPLLLVGLPGEAHSSAVLETEMDQRLPALWPVLRSRSGLAVLATMSAAGILAGVYESCWTLLLAHRHAAPGAVTLSWALYAIPFVLAAPLGGLLVDRADRRLLMLFAVLLGMSFAIVYSFVGSVPALITLSACEGLGVALAGPAAQAVLSALVVPESQGRALGAAGGAQTLATAIGALAGGALFSVHFSLPFLFAGATGALASLAIFGLVIRPGRARSAAQEPA